MLKFYRKAFKTGVMVIKEQRDTGKKDEAGKPIIEVKAISLKPSDMGKSFEFWNEAEILKKYPHSFSK
jgi:hypothetical protein